jgi:hypothetical protein
MHQGGYRWQFGSVVFGAEVEGDWANMRASLPSQLPGNPGRNRFDQGHQRLSFHRRTRLRLERSVALFEVRRGDDEQQPAN